MNLQLIDFTGNELNSVPDQLLDLYRLGSFLADCLSTNSDTILIFPSEELLLNENKISKIPWKLNRLRRLKTLSIKDNELKYLPTPLVESAITSSRYSLFLSFHSFYFLSSRPLFVPSHPSHSMEALGVLEVLPNPFDILVYGSARSADELLVAVAKQKVPPIYAEEVRQLAKKPTSGTMAAKILHTMLKYKEGVKALEAFTQKEKNGENLQYES